MVIIYCNVPNEDGNEYFLGDSILDCNFMFPYKDVGEISMRGR